jgi:selenocysteine lyase/cysteine desulfurase
MNFCDINNCYYPIQYIERLANEKKISLRTGCFCNPGIDELNHGLSANQLDDYFSGREQGDYFDIIRYLGQVRGAIRLSVGFITTRADIEKFVNFAETLLNRKAPENELLNPLLLSPSSFLHPSEQ